MQKNDTAWPPRKLGLLSGDHTYVYVPSVGVASVVVQYCFRRMLRHWQKRTHRQKGKIIIAMVAGPGNIQAVAVGTIMGDVGRKSFRHDVRFQTEERVQVG